MQSELKGLFEKPISERSLHAKFRKYGLWTDQVTLTCYKAAASDYRIFKTMEHYHGEFFAKQAVIYARNYNFWLWIGFVSRLYEKIFNVDLSSNSDEIMKSSNSIKVKELLLELHRDIVWANSKMTFGKHLMPIYPGSDYGLVH